MKITKKAIKNIYSELKIFEKNIIYAKDTDKLIKEQFLKVFNAFSKLDSIEDNFQELFIEPTKLAILIYIKQKAMNYKSFEEDVGLYPIITVKELYSNKADINEIKNKNSYFFSSNRNYKDFNDFEKDLILFTVKFLKYAQEQNIIHLSMSLFNYTKYLTTYLIFKKYNLYDYIPVKYKELLTKIQETKSVKKQSDKNTDWDIISIEGI